MPKNERNSARHNGKKWKQKPGVAKSAHNGKTTGGYSPAKQAQREAKRGVTA